MRSIIVTSTKPFAGKSGIALSLIAHLGGLGYDVGYFKPYGTMPVVDGGLTTDEDALYLNRMLPRPSAPADVCPVVRTQALIERVLAGQEIPTAEEVLAAFGRCAEGRDVMVVEGSTEPAQGSCVGLSAVAVAALIDARCIVVDRPRPTDLPEDALFTARLFGDRLGGMILNGVDESRLSQAHERVVPYLERQGVAVFGVIPHDQALGAVTVEEIVDALGGTVLTAQDNLGLPVENFMVGAMGQDRALRFFRRKKNKAVITGGDRADVQLAALETSTRCIVLTGNQLPDAVVQSRAEELGVPMIVVDSDTLSAVERMETLLGRVHLHDPDKAARIRGMFEHEINIGRLLTAVGIGAEPR